MGAGCLPSCGLDLCLFLCVEGSQISWKGNISSRHVNLIIVSSVSLTKTTLEVIKKNINRCLLHGLNFPNLVFLVHRWLCPAIFRSYYKKLSKRSFHIYAIVRFSSQNLFNRKRKEENFPEKNWINGQIKTSSKNHLNY